MKKITTLVLILSISALFLAGCSGGNTNKTSKGEIVFADAGWESNKFHNAVAGLVAKEIWGYSWTEIPGSTAVLHEGLLIGEVDIHMEEWTDNIPQYQPDVAEGKLEELSVNFDDNFQGLYVPRYVIEGDAEKGIEALAPDLKTVKDLEKYPHLFPDGEVKGKGRIYGAIPGWEVDTILGKKVKYLGLDDKYEYFSPGSDAALQSAIISAYDIGKPIVAYYWEPTWLLGMYDMVLLEDEPYIDDAAFKEGKTELPAMNVTIAASNRFYEDENNKEFIEFLSKYSSSSALTSKALAYMQTNDADYEEAAKWFLSEHEDLVRAWLNEIDAKKLMETLGK